MTFTEQIQKQLSNPKRFIAINNADGLKLVVPDKKNLKNNWTFNDIIADSGSIEGFFASLQKRGFGSGSTLIIREQTGSTTKKISESKIQFADDTQNTEENKTPMEQSQPAPAYNNTLGYAQPPAVQGDYLKIPQHEYLRLKVLEGRFTDIEKKLNDSDSELKQSKSDYRIEKERAEGLQRRIDTLEDKHELVLERERAAKKSFLDTEAGKEAVNALGTILPAVMEKFSIPKQQQALGSPNPMANLRPEQAAVINKIVQVPLDVLPVIDDSIDQILQGNEMFLNQLEQILPLNNQQ